MFRLIFVQTKPEQIIPAFAPEVQFHIKPVVQPAGLGKVVQGERRLLVLSAALTGRRDSSRRFNTFNDLSRDDQLL